MSLIVPCTLVMTLCTMVVNSLVSHSFNVKSKILNKDPHSFLNCHTHSSVVYYCVCKDKYMQRLQPSIHLAIRYSPYIDHMYSQDFECEKLHVFRNIIYANASLESSLLHAEIPTYGGVINALEIFTITQNIPSENFSWKFYNFWTQIQFFSINATHYFQNNYHLIPSHWWKLSPLHTLPKSFLTRHCATSMTTVQNICYRYIFYVNFDHRYQSYISSETMKITKYSIALPAGSEVWTDEPWAPAIITTLNT